MGGAGDNCRINQRHFDAGELHEIRYLNQTLQCSWLLRLRCKKKKLYQLFSVQGLLRQFEAGAAKFTGWNIM